MLYEFDLVNHIVLLLLIALFIIGWHLVTRPGMLLDFIGKRFLYIEEEELLKRLPVEVREQKQLAVMVFEGQLKEIPKEGMDVDCLKLELMKDFEEYLKDINVKSDVNFEHLAASYEMKKDVQRWKKWIGPPLGNCTACSASVFGTLGMVLAYYPMMIIGTSPVVWAVLIASLPAISGITHVIGSKQ